MQVLRDYFHFLLSALFFFIIFITFFSIHKTSQLLLCVRVCVCVRSAHVCLCVCVRVDLRLGWEPCSVPAWLINGVVMAIGRNEGTTRRRPPR